MITVIIGVAWYLSNYQTFKNDTDFFANPNNFPIIMWGDPRGFNWQNINYYLFDKPSGPWGIGAVLLITGILVSVISIKKIIKKKRFFYSG